MEGKSVVVKQNPIFISASLIFLSLICCGCGIVTLILAENSDYLWAAFWMFIVAVVFVFFALTAKLYIRAEDIYTETGMIQKRGNKVLYELEWENVEKIYYYKVTLSSILMYCPTAFMIFQKEPPKNKKQAKIFLTYYSMKEIKKIQSIIPIEIQY